MRDSFDLVPPDHLLWAGALAFVLFRGPGRWSLDAFIRRRRYGEGR